MLILTRRVGETIVIGDEVIITVLGIKGNQVRIGINAPKDVSVHREEIYQRIQKEKEEKSSSASAAAPAPKKEEAAPVASAPTTPTIRKKRESKIDKADKGNE